MSNDIDLALLFPADLMRRIAELDGRDAGAAEKFAARLIVVLDHHVAESLRAGGTLRQAGFTATAEALDGRSLPAETWVVTSGHTR